MRRKKTLVVKKIIINRKIMKNKKLDRARNEKTWEKSAGIGQLIY